ncbi:hypothetical protein BU23DRAFT_337151 [Bimuria novae-zelandiae CBS 107.79]|uniref:Protein PBN1 n=1 Tax=Bimuria novae-zelandiae CBS 107.79 TaxID=1447943 RepID=A0A6A5UQ26_9PLEO|nr:hypothetical protein BU23DRAFT_337151 [Bimuria novae-zelandiae CBS 107.79]
MRARPWLLCISAAVVTVNANVEKTVFLGPAALHLPPGWPSLEDLHVDTLTPTGPSLLATQLPVQFPTEKTPRGLESWYILRSLERGRRYEVRICWPAFQPTDFWLDTFPVDQVFDTPELLSSLAEYSQQRQSAPLQKLQHSSATPQSVLFLRIQAAASYYSTNKTLMEYPPPVDVDIILDPFILNILPHSLGPTAIYLSAVAVAAWFISGYIYRAIIAVSEELDEKDHKD